MFVATMVVAALKVNAVIRKSSATSVARAAPDSASSRLCWALM